MWRAHDGSSFAQCNLAEVYAELCQAVSVVSGGRRPKCMLHFGEFFSTADFLYSNTFFRLAKLPQVTDLIMDSNVALLGAPSSPSVVGVLISAARVYNKTVHFEAATERIFPCGRGGKVVLTESPAAMLMYTHGFQRALEAGVDALGVTNLCEPNFTSYLFPSLSGLLSVKQPPTAVIFAPYRRFYAWNLLGTGECGEEQRSCWDPSFASLPRFGTKSPKENLSMCVFDILQAAMVDIWDDLRARHTHVAVLGEARQLVPESLDRSTERVLLSFNCVLNETTWDIVDGKQELALFDQVRMTYPFRTVRVAKVRSAGKLGFRKGLMLMCLFCNN